MTANPHILNHIDIVLNYIYTGTHTQTSTIYI